MVLLAAGAVAIAFIAELPKMFFGTLGAYVLVNLFYSLGLKQVPIVELFLVSSGFVLRLLAGAYAISVELSPWIVVATGTISLLLAASKRRGDIAHDYDAQQKRRSLSGYSLAYLDAVSAALTGATFVVYLLFCVSDYAAQRYGPGVLVTAVPVAMGLMRYLQLVITRGDGDSPTDLLLKDKGLIAAVIVFMVMFGGLIYAK
jgi:4-hydroxybenzoate polyprenyltransferase